MLTANIPKLFSLFGKSPLNKYKSPATRKSQVKAAIRKVLKKGVLRIPGIGQAIKSDQMRHVMNKQGKREKTSQNLGYITESP